MSQPQSEPTVHERSRLLFIHAHPDDETLWSGVTLAHYAGKGADVHVLTCTLGDEGEVIPPELAHHAPDQENTLGQYRRGELRAAMKTIGAREHVLGENPLTMRGARYRDSGMAGTDENNDPRALCRADLGSLAARIRARIVRLAPDAVITYEATGGYGHPDHIRVHEATRAAIAGLPAEQQPPLYVILVPDDVAREDRRWLQCHVSPASGLRVPAIGDPYPPSVVNRELVTHVVHGSSADLALRDAALAHHRTQATVYQGYYALSNDVAARLPRTEYFARIDPVTGSYARRIGAPVEGLV
ncbi:PIG-L family deacetylase [Dermatophilus congolensis]|uniref:PIG-L family deacetylase n=1 Tax=Dermatophilus congolensis TaxID=1863 RepID=UPI000E0E89A1|nr:PIG-L family deacetylase [Dermatophilus congolensis]